MEIEINGISPKAEVKGDSSEHLGGETPRSVGSRSPDSENDQSSSHEADLFERYLSLGSEGEIHPFSIGDPYGLSSKEFSSQISGTEGNSVGDWVYEESLERSSGEMNGRNESTGCARSESGDKTDG